MKRAAQGRLNYVLENCQTAYRELCRVNKELQEAMNTSSPINPQPLGDLNRMIQDYLIVRIAGLFDKDSRVISFATLFHGSKELQSIRKEKVIKDIIHNRHNWVAHNNRNGQVMATADICNSNLEEILERMKKMVN